MVYGRSIIAVTRSYRPPKTSPHLPNGRLLLRISDESRRCRDEDELEEQVRGLGFERDVADFMDDKNGIPAELAQFGLQPSLVVSGLQPVDPFGRRGEQHPLARLCSRMPSPMARCVLPSSSWA